MRQRELSGVHRLRLGACGSWLAAQCAPHAVAAGACGRWLTDSAEVHGIARQQEGDAVDEGWGKAPRSAIRWGSRGRRRGVKARAPVPVEDQDRGAGGEISRTGRASVWCDDRAYGGPVGSRPRRHRDVVPGAEVVGGEAGVGGPLRTDGHGGGDPRLGDLAVAVVGISAHRDHVPDEAEGRLVGRNQLTAAVDVDGRMLRVDGEDGVDLGGEQVG
jgi:hypothetical protein